MRGFAHDRLQAAGGHLELVGKMDFFTSHKELGQHEGILIGAHD
jgi:hypothetical protein